MYFTKNKKLAKNLKILQYTTFITVQKQFKAFLEKIRTSAVAERKRPKYTTTDPTKNISIHSFTLTAPDVELKDN